MLRSLFSLSRSSVIRGVHLYFGREQVIVVPMHQNLAGIYYEQPGAMVIQAPLTVRQLGEAFSRAFAMFSVKDANLRDSKRSEWPAFVASGLRSIKEFERMYRCIGCYSVNSANAIVRASTSHPVFGNIELSASFNPHGSPEAIGAALIELRDAANTT